MSQHPLASKVKFLNSSVCSIIRHQESETVFWKFLSSQWGAKAGWVQSLLAVTHPFVPLASHECRCRQFVEMVNGTDSEVRCFSARSPRSQDSYPGSPSLSPRHGSSNSHVHSTGKCVLCLQVRRAGVKGGCGGVQHYLLLSMCYSLKCSCPFLPQLRGCSFTMGVTQLVLH